LIPENQSCVVAKEIHFFYFTGTGIVFYVPAGLKGKDSSFFATDALVSMMHLTQKTKQKKSCPFGQAGKTLPYLTKTCSQPLSQSQPLTILL